MAVVVVVVVATSMVVDDGGDGSTSRTGTGRIGVRWSAILEMVPLTTRHSNRSSSNRSRIFGILWQE